MWADSGTNSKAKLVALWGLLYFTQKKDLLSISIFGDSKAIIDWDKDIHSLHNLELQHWVGRTKNIILNFQLITFNHIYRELNTEDDVFSKLGLKEDMEKIEWEFQKELALSIAY